MHRAAGASLIYAVSCPYLPCGVGEGKHVEEVMWLNILAASDLHDPERLGKLAIWAKENEYNFGFVLGDFGTGRKQSKDIAVTVALRTMPVLLPRVHVLYGNHDHLDIVQEHPLWLKDGLHELYGFKVFVVNGIWGTNPNKPWHRRVQPKIKLAEKTGQVDILLTHEHPWGLEFQTGSGRFKFEEHSEWHKLFADAVAKYLKPKIWLYGHSYAKEPERVIPGLNIRTLGLDGHFIMLNKDLQIVSRLDV